MSPYIAIKLYTHLLLLLYFVLLTFFICHATLGITDTNILCVENERDALFRFKDGIHVDHCGRLNSWGGTQECCLWDGIHCDGHSGHVISLHLPGNGVSFFDEYKPCLEGTLGNSLLELKHLKYLNLSGNNFHGQTIPKFIGSLANLEHLDLSSGGFSGIIPKEIGNLSRLSSLYLDNQKLFDQDYHYTMKVESLEWLSQLRLLREVDLSYIDLSLTTDTWLAVVNSLPFLQILSFDYCELSLKLPSSLSYINSSTTLSYISLNGNHLNDTGIFEWLFNLIGLDTNLVLLDLGHNDQMFGNSVQLFRASVKFLSNLCSLQTLNLEGTKLNYDFSDIIQSFSTCVYKTLESLDLGFNNIWGSVPGSIGAFRSLKELYVNYNKLNGTISPALGQLYSLEILNFNSNSLRGALTTTCFSNPSKLVYLGLENNMELSVNININANWTPPFQLSALLLSFCKVGPDFPKWLLTQNNLEILDISNVGISDIIPTSFWTSSLSGIDILYMSHNNIYGTLPNEFNIFHLASFIDLSFNNFEGAIPSFLRNNVSALLLNNNNFSKGLHSFLCSKTKKPMFYLDLSNNLFSEKLPNCWGGFHQLFVLHLEYNNLWGNIPASIETLKQLGSLQLNNNNLSGELPTSLVNCRSLIILNLANNSLGGYIPPSYGYNFHNLSILSLQNNYFYGGLPSSFCHLSQLQLLDLSQNNISGTIPRCIGKLIGMANTGADLLLEFEKALISNVLGDYIYENVRIMWKGREQTFGGNNSLRLLKGIDLADNNLEGQIPYKISSLVGIRYLNLSRNNLSGAIMSRIGQLAILESLDLSHNHLSGKIPNSLAQITNLAVLDFSNNNLSGEIPVGPQLQLFDALAYSGNPQLCGAPLSKCNADEIPVSQPRVENAAQRKRRDLEGVMLGLYISVVLGFITGFWAVFGSLALKRSWRHALFQLYDNAKDEIYVMVVVKMRAWTRRL